MLKIPENKTRKRFRIAQCIFYALLVMLCSMPYIQGATTDGKFFSYSVLDLMSFIGGTADGTLGDAFFKLCNVHSYFNYYTGNRIFLLPF